MATVTATYLEIAVEADKSFDVVALHPVLRAQSREIPCLVPDHVVLLAAVAGELALDQPAQRVTGREDADRRLATEVQQSETDLRGEREITGPVETNVEETLPQQAASAGLMRVDRARQHPRGADIHPHQAVQGHPNTETLGGSVGPHRHPLRDHVVAVQEDDPFANLSAAAPRLAAVGDSDGLQRAAQARWSRRKTTSGRDEEVDREAKRIAKQEMSLRESGDTLLTPLVPMTDQLMFRKMKIDPNLQDTARRRRPMRTDPRVLAQTKTPQQRANELREKLLKERIKKMRSTSSSDNVNE
ncbi:hypothetical protein AAE478_000832 [Parahypoxylon ruwenzoriense]